MLGFCRVDYYFLKCLVFVEWIFVKAGHPHVLVKWLFAFPKPWNCGLGGMLGTEASAGMLREEGSHRVGPGCPECRQSLMTQPITSPGVLLPGHPGIIIVITKVYHMPALVPSPLCGFIFPCGCATQHAGS